MKVSILEKQEDKITFHVELPSFYYKQNRIKHKSHVVEKHLRKSYNLKEFEMIQFTGCISNFNAPHHGTYVFTKKSLPKAAPKRTRTKKTIVVKKEEK